MSTPKVGRNYRSVDENGTPCVVLGVRERGGVEWVLYRMRGSRKPDPLATVEEFYRDFKEEW